MTEKGRDMKDRRNIENLITLMQREGGWEVKKSVQRIADVNIDLMISLSVGFCGRRGLGLDENIKSVEFWKKSAHLCELVPQVVLRISTHTTSRCLLPVTAAGFSYLKVYTQKI